MKIKINEYYEKYYMTFWITTGIVVVIFGAVVIINLDRIINWMNV